MRVIITIQHPAHVHFYRNVIGLLTDRGHEVFVFARENDLAVPLLERYGVPHEVLAGPQASLAGLARAQLTYEWRLLRRARAIEPDVMTAIGGVAVSHVARLVGARSVVFLDNEGIASHRITVPFADVVATPRQFGEDLGDGHRRYDGYHELAYLHPERFEPSPDRLRAHGVEPEAPYAVLRFKRWDALHDVGEAGLSPAGKGRLVSTFADAGDVFVTSTDPLPPALASCQLPVPPELIHDLLYFADWYAGDSATMATEAALLATPSLRVQSFADHEADLSNFLELAEYGLVRSTADEEEGLSIAREWVADSELAATWRHRRRRLLEEKIDVVPFVADLLVEPEAATGRAQPTATG